MYHFVLHIWIASQKNILIHQQSIDKDRNPVPGWPASKLSGALCRRGGKRKDSFELRLWNLNIDLHRKCRCEMLVGGDDVSNDIITPVFFFYISARFRFALIGGNWTAQLTGSHRGIGGGIQLRETYLQALLPFPTPPPKRPGQLARRLVPGIRKRRRGIQNLRDQDCLGFPHTG